MTVKFLKSRYTPFTTIVLKDGRPLNAINSPVNLERCTAIISKDYVLKDDITLKQFNIDEKEKYPSIEFVGTGIIWVYQTIENRDDEYNKIVKKFCITIDEI